MITQLMGQNDLVDLDFENEMMKVPSIKRTQVNMAVLTSWYQELTSTAVQDDLPSKLRGSPQKVAGYTCKDVTSCKAMASPHKTMASPRKTMASPRKTIASPRKIMVSPNKTIASPRKTVAVPCKIMESTCRTMESPSKSKKSPAKKMKLSNEPSLPKRGLRPPLVVILEDVESFPANILHDLILICRYVYCMSVSFDCMRDLS
nr:uncharacterized protein LOC123754672 [Procambarus clarkii]